jgi:hypothetical protein
MTTLKKNRKSPARLRDKFVGLALSGQAVEQVARVSEVLFHTPIGVSSSCAREAVQWGVTDALFEASRGGYEEVVRSLQEKPHAYRLAIVRERLLDDRVKGGEFHGVEEVQEECEMDEELDAFLDPFALPPSRVVDMNSQAVGGKAPPQIWEQKLDLLAQLTPRKKDAMSRSGTDFVYRESEEERRQRVRAGRQLASSAAAEASRRQEAPSEDEQVEDVLQDLLRNVDREVLRRERRETRVRWETAPTACHPSCRGHGMRRLRGAGGGESFSVTDIDPPAAHLTRCGEVTPFLTPSADRVSLRVVFLVDPFLAAPLATVIKAGRRTSMESALGAALAELLYVPSNRVVLEELRATTAGVWAVQEVHSYLQELAGDVNEATRCSVVKEDEDEKKTSSVVVTMGHQAVEVLRRVVTAALDSVLDSDIEALLLTDGTRRGASAANMLKGTTSAERMAALRDRHLETRRKERGGGIPFQLPALMRLMAGVKGSQQLAKAGERVCLEVLLSLYISDSDRARWGPMLTSEDLALHLEGMVQGHAEFTVEGRAAMFVSSRREQNPHLAYQFSSWPAFHAHFVHPAFFGYATQRPENRGGRKDPLAVSLLSPLDFLSGPARVVLKGLGGDPLTSINMQEGVTRHKPRVRASSVTPAQLSLLRQQLFRAEEELAVHQANRRAAMQSGLTREELRLLGRRDLAKRLHDTALRWLEAQAGESILRARPTMEIVAPADYEQEEVPITEVGSVRRRHKEQLEGRVQRDKERLLRLKVGAQREWLLRALAAAAGGLRVEESLREEVRRQEESLRVVDQTSGVVSEAVRVKVKEAEAQRRLIDLSEQRTTRELFRAMLILRGPVDEDTPNSLRELDSSAGALHNLNALSVSWLLGILEAAFAEIGAAELRRVEWIKVEAARSKELARERRQAQLLDVQQRSVSQGSLVQQLARAITPAMTMLDAEVKAEPGFWSMLRLLRWPARVCRDSVWRGCLERLPTLSEGKVCEDELVQFASMLALLDPLLASVTRGAQTPGIPDPGLTPVLAPKSPTTEVVEESSVQRDVSLVRQQAHQHVYVMLAELGLVCTVCMQRSLEAWRMMTRLAEERKIQDFSSSLQGDAAAIRTRLIDGEDVSDLCTYTPTVSFPLREWTERGIGKHTFTTLVSQRLITTTLSSSIDEDDSCIPSAVLEGRLQVKVWSWDAYSKDQLLGVVEFSQQDLVLSHTDRGIRYYPMLSTAGGEVTGGQLAVRLQVLGQASVRVQICGARRLPAVSGDDLSNPYAEVLWRAPDQPLSSTTTDPHDWASVGRTVPRGCTLDPQWDSVSASFLLPPTWHGGEVVKLDSDAPGGLITLLGAWVARDYDPTVLTDTRTRSVLSLIEARQARPAVESGDLEETQKCVDTYVRARLCEEDERRLMCWEEDAGRRQTLESLLDAHRMQIAEQKLMSKEFSTWCVYRSNNVCLL